MAEKDIVTTAVEAGNFTTLAAALEVAGLVSVLQGEGPFPVFAPTAAAFAKLPAGTVEALLADKEALTRVLTYHFVAGRVTSAAAGLSRHLPEAPSDHAAAGRARPPLRSCREPSLDIIARLFVPPQPSRAASSVARFASSS